MALLAKQEWRIQQNLDSLVHKVFKVKYFVKTYFMEAQLGKRPLYIWRSILVAREVIKEGYRWVIGNERNVHIWNDRWIPVVETHKVMSPKVPISRGGEMVSNLQDEENRAWNTNLVRNTILPHEADVILSISISLMVPRDS